MVYTAASIESFVDDMNGALSKADCPRRVFIMFSDASSSFFSCIAYRVQHVKHEDDSLFFYNDRSEVVAEVELGELGDGYRLDWDSRSGFTVFFHHA